MTYVEWTDQVLSDSRLSLEAHIQVGQRAGLPRHLTDSPSEAQGAWQVSPVYDSKRLLPLRVAQHLPAGEEKPWKQACRAVLKGSKSRDRTWNLETGRGALSAARLGMFLNGWEGPDVPRAFLAAELLDNDLWTSKASQGHCIIIWMGTKMQAKKGQVLFSLALTQQFLQKVCQETYQSASWACVLVSTSFLSQWAL